MFLILERAWLWSRPYFVYRKLYLYTKLNDVKLLRCLVRDRVKFAKNVMCLKTVYSKDGLMSYLAIMKKFS